MTLDRPAMAERLRGIERTLAQARASVRNAEARRVGDLATLRAALRQLEAYAEVMWAVGLLAAASARLADGDGSDLEAWATWSSSFTRARAALAAADAALAAGEQPGLPETPLAELRDLVRRAEALLPAAATPA
jgi:hypothetical protein